MGVEKFNLPNGNKLSYGQINGLGGDFFATMTPICMGSSFEEQCTLFEKAFATSATNNNVAVKGGHCYHPEPGRRNKSHWKG
jgi:hypothetical protein